jgi:hypothetical protein
VFTAEQGDRVEGWQTMVQEWEKDQTKPNPYEMKTHGRCSMFLCESVADGD